MYSTKSNLILGFHGCRKSIIEDVVLQKTTMKASNNAFDWLGSGIYFWENNFQRAYEWAVSRYGEADAAVLGGVLSLGKCLDFLDSKYLALLEPAYQRLKIMTEKAGFTKLPENTSDDHDSFLCRKLDCAIIKLIIDDSRRQKSPFDSVRGVFWEGEVVYPSAGFKRANHIQVSIVNPNCIKGFFLPRSLATDNDSIGELSL